MKQTAQAPFATTPNRQQSLISAGGNILARRRESIEAPNSTAEMTIVPRLSLGNGMKSGRSPSLTPVPDDPVTGEARRSGAAVLAGSLRPISPRPLNLGYMIAVGGAGSSAAPAFPRGTKIK
jgi:hypothetical protein